VSWQALQVGLTENDGHENDGPSKKIAEHENARHEIDGPMCRP